MKPHEEFIKEVRNLILTNTSPHQKLKALDELAEKYFNTPKQEKK